MAYCFEADWNHQIINFSFLLNRINNIEYVTTSVVGENLKLRFYKKRLWLWGRSLLARDPESFCQYGLNVKVPVTADLSIRYNLAHL